MNRLLENGLISEMDCGSNFAYILQDESIFLSTEYKVLHSQEDGCFVKCMKLLFNGKLQFYYMTNGWKSLGSMLSMLDADSFMTIISNMLSNMIIVKNNGFLSCRNIDISFERIYVDPNTYKVKLIYLPVSSRFFADESLFENELRTSLVKILSGMENLSSVKTLQFTSDLSNGMMSLEDVYNKIKGGKTGNSVNTPVYHENPQGACERRMKIVGLNAPGRVEIDVTKDNFIIGKTPSSVDGVVSFNKMISRVHCKIVKNGGNYQVIDLMSSNGTYVNRTKLQPNQPYPLNHGDILRMANSNFQVVIE